jgi:hypothetical protein
MRKLLIYLSVIGVSLAILPLQAEAGSRHKKKDRFWARHHSHYARQYYRHYHPNHYWRYPYYYGYYRYPYQYYGYPDRPGISFSFQFD